MRAGDLKGGLLGVGAALGASTCCVLPLAFAAVGLGAGAGTLMAWTLPLQPVLYPLGVLALALGYVLYFRRRRLCATAACTMAGGRTNLTLLLVATAMMAVNTYVDFFLGSL